MKVKDGKQTATDEFEAYGVFAICGVGTISAILFGQFFDKGFWLSAIFGFLVTLTLIFVVGAFRSWVTEMKFDIKEMISDLKKPIEAATKK